MAQVVARCKSVASLLDLGRLLGSQGVCRLVVTLRRVELIAVNNVLAGVAQSRHVGLLVVRIVVVLGIIV